MHLLRRPGLRGPGDGYRIITFSRQGTGGPGGLGAGRGSGAAGAPPGRAASGSSSATGGQLAGGTATLQEIPVPCDRASDSLSEDGSLQPDRDAEGKLEWRRLGPPRSQKAI